MKMCQKCQIEVPDNEAFCPGCGQYIQSRSGLGLVAKIIVAVLISLGFLGLGTFGACVISAVKGYRTRLSPLFIAIIILWGLSMWALFRKKK